MGLPGVYHFHNFIYVKDPIMGWIQRCAVCQCSPQQGGCV